MKQARCFHSWKDLLHPCFSCGMDEICPFIWVGWWLITFDPDPLRSFWSYIKTVNISFMPD